MSLIGRGGCYFRAEEVLRVGTVLRLKIKREGNVFESWARVADVDETGMGLAFLRAEHSQVRTLNQWLESLAERHSQ